MAAFVAWRSPWRAGEFKLAAADHRGDRLPGSSLQTVSGVIMNLLKSTLSSAFVLAGAVLACTSAQAAPACASVSQIERRIVERADGGGDVAALRDFVWRTSVVYRVNMIDVREKLDQWRAAVECRKEVAQAGAPGDADATKVVAQR
jgi:hypothetical protein